MFLVVVLLTLGFLALYALGVRQVFNDRSFGTLENIDPTAFAGSVLLGLSMFATLFLGAVLAVFLTLGVVRGDAERGLLQPLVVRPLGRRTFLLARFGAAAGVCTLYVWAVFTGCLVITHWLGNGWWPDRIVAPALGLAAAVVAVVALSLLGSVYLSGTANGIAVFMLFGAGLVAGLLGQIGEALDSHALERAAKITSCALPFEALYQNALNAISSESFGLSRVALQLGPFGGAEAGGSSLWLYSLAYLCVVALLAAVGFDRRDL